MKRSAASSRSSVVTPARAFERSIWRQRARIAPERAMASISSGDFLMITGLELLFQPQCCERCADVVVHLTRRPAAVEAAEHAALLVVVNQRLGLRVVDLEPLLDRLRLVVVALDQPRAVLVTDALVLRRVEVDVVDVAVLDAYAASGDPLDDLVVRGIDQKHRGQRAPPSLERVLEDVGLLGVAREAVEQEAVLGLRLVDPLHDDLADEVVGNEV